MYTEMKCWYHINFMVYAGIGFLTFSLPSCNFDVYMLLLLNTSIVLNTNAAYCLLLSWLVFVSCLCAK